MRLVLFAFSWIIILFATDLPAQPRFNYPIHYFSFYPQIDIQHIRIEKNGIRQTLAQHLLPFLFKVPVTETAEVQVNTYYADNYFTGENRYSLQGLTDTRIQLYYKWPERNILLKSGVNLPTGKNAYDSEELLVADLLAEPIFGFRAKRLGRGFDANLGISFALPVGNLLALGFSSGYYLFGSYFFQKNREEKFKPGNEFFLSSGVDFKKNAVRFRGDILYRNFAQDRLASQNIFQQGSQLEIDGILQYRLNPLFTSLKLRNIIKGNNELLFQDAGGIGDRNFIGNYFWLEGNCRYDQSQILSFEVIYSLSRFGKSDFQISDATLQGFGGGMYIKYQERALVHLTVNTFSGNAENGSIKITGWDFNTAFVFKF